MDVGILGHVLLALEHRGSKMEGVCLMPPPLPATPGSGCCPLRKEPSALSLGVQRSPGSGQMALVTG